MRPALVPLDQLEFEVRDRGERILLLCLLSGCAGAILSAVILLTLLWRFGPV